MAPPFKALVVPGGLALYGCLDIGQPDLRSEKVKDLLGTLTWGEIMDITHPIQDSEKLEDILGILTWGELVDISQPIQSSEKIEELQDPVICQDKPEILDIGQADETCKEEEMTSSTGQGAKPLPLLTLTPEKPIVHKRPQRPQMLKSPKESTSQFVWEARVPKSLIGRFVGEEGWQVKSLVEESGAEMDITPLTSSGKFQLILVTGTLKQIDKAAAVIRDWFKTFKVNLPLYTLRRVSLPSR